MAKVDVIIRCADADELNLAIRYLNWKGHNEADGTLLVYHDAFTLVALNEKEIDALYVNRKMLEEQPEPPVPPRG